MTRMSNPQDSQALPQQAEQNGKRILIVEDDPFISRMYTAKLQTAGFVIELSSNGRDAYEKLKSQEYDLLLMDINIPELTGFEVLKALKNDGRSDIAKKAIVLTNSANPEDHGLADQLGVEYMVKSELTPHQVLERINQKLGL
ncbi:response regulator [Patescibacteria group bacterium]|nr:MAG: response regulator [Patescibacteria group bacterium]